MKKEHFDRRAAEMRQRMLAAQGTQLPVPSLTLVRKGASSAVEPTMNLKEAARRIGVSYQTANRMLAAEPGVRRFAIAPSGKVIYPDTQLKRGQRVRFTYVIPVSIVDHVIQRLSGQLRAA
ncbi:MAG: hypothetical protein NTV52_00705 [Acidobacteria bacterium]|nr:hypothetical protein [Acidobacteriota bacterium]